MTLDAFLTLLHNPRPVKSWYTAECPAHDDRSRNTLKVRAGRDERILVKCWAGCTLDEILRALRLARRDLFPATTTTARRAKPLTDTTPWPVLVRAALRETYHDFRRLRAERADLYAHAQEIRAMTRLIDDARRHATDTEAGWLLLTLAADLERDVHQLESA